MLRPWLLSNIKSSLNTFNLDLNRSMNLATLARNLEIDTFLDIGANVGQFAKYLRRLGYEKEILSFEPLSIAHEKLLRVSRRDSHWTVHERCALGSEFSQKLINVSKNSYSSSILNVLRTHLDAAPDSSYIDCEKVQIVTLDQVFKDRELKRSRIAMKIDTQGYELEVLKGGLRALENTLLIQVEVSMHPLYESGPIYKEVIRHLEADFVLWDLKPGFRDIKTRKLLQMDAVFVNRNVVDKLEMVF